MFATEQLFVGNVLEMKVYYTGTTLNKAGVHLHGNFSV